MASLTPAISYWTDGSYLAGAAVPDAGTEPSAHIACSIAVRAGFGGADLVGLETCAEQL